MPGHKYSFGSNSRQSDHPSAAAAIEYAEECNGHYYCNVDMETYSRNALILDWFFIVIMVGLGIFIMLNGIYTVAK